MSINILMPALSPTMEKGNLARWLVKEGDKVSAGDVIAEIETDKAIMEFESIEDGIVGKILVPEGTNDVAVNTPIAILLESGESVDSLIPTKDKSLLELSQKNDIIQMKDSTNSIILNQENIFQSESKNRIIASPLAKRLAKDLHIDLFDIKGTGPNGRIIKNDILKFSENISVEQLCTIQKTKDHVVSFDAPCEIRPISNMRRIIAERLSESKQKIPHFYLNIDIFLDSLLDLRKKINSFESNIFKISINDFIIKACAKALSMVPDVNVAWSSSNPTGLKYYKRADIAIAVAIDDGLITPIIRGACEKTLHTVAQETKELISLAKSNKLKPEQYQGGTFSISNLGMYGISSFSAIINPPQACILAVGAVTQRPICCSGKEIISASVMTVTLSVDHRAIDGATAAIFLQTLKKIIETPILILC